jgi:hypothetical protein
MSRTPPPPAPAIAHEVGARAAAAAAASYCELRIDFFFPRKKKNQIPRGCSLGGGVAFNDADGPGFSSTQQSEPEGKEKDGAAAAAALPRLEKAGGKGGGR